MSFSFFTRRKEKGKQRVVHPHPLVQEEWRAESSTSEAADAVGANPVLLLSPCSRADENCEYIDPKREVWAIYSDGSTTPSRVQRRVKPHLARGAKRY